MSIIYDFKFTFHKSKRQNIQLLQASQCNTQRTFFYEVMSLIKRRHEKINFV